MTFDIRHWVDLYLKTNRCSAEHKCFVFYGTRMFLTLATRPHLWTLREIKADHDNVLHDTAHIVLLSK